MNNLYSKKVVLNLYIDTSRTFFVLGAKGAILPRGGEARAVGHPAGKGFCEGARVLREPHARVDKTYGRLTFLVVHV